MRNAVVLVATLLLALAAVCQSPDDDPNRPVLKRRPPANDSSQPTTQPAPQPAPQPQDNTPQLKRRPPDEAGQQSPNEQAGPPPQVQQTPSSPPDHHAEVMQHGAETMGFSQQTTTHHFRLTRSGGVIRVTVNDPNDTDGAGQISVHLRQTASQFARGDFSAPERTHSTRPPGTAVMQQLRSKIIYTAHAIDGGAELIISSQDQKAIDAIHQFLQFQIQEHQTGDSVAVR